jgi:hypothetical protein
MECKELEIYSELSNYAIVRMPGRAFPGCVVQGDSLSILLHTAERAYELALRTGHEELIDEVAGLKEALEDRLTYYESVITAHGFQLPYVRKRVP